MSNRSMTGITAAKLLRYAIIATVLAASLMLMWIHVRIITQPFAYSASTRVLVGNDFIAFYAAGKLAAAGQPERAYDLNALHSVEKRIGGSDDFPLTPMPYPPFFQLLMMPLSNLDYLTAYRVWVAVTTGLLLLVAWRLAPHWQNLLLAAIFPAVVFCASTGQNGNLSAAIVGAAMLLLPRRPVAAGIAFGLMAYKPQLMLAIPLCLLAGRHYRTLVATAAAALATVLLSLLFFGIGPFVSFVLNISAHSRLVFDDPQFGNVLFRMPTVFVTLLQLTGRKDLAFAIHFLIAGAAAFGLMRVWYRSTNPALRTLALGAAMPLLSPYFTDYDLSLLLIPFVLLAEEARTTGWSWKPATVMAALWLVPPIFFLLKFVVPVSAVVPLAPVAWVLLLAYAVAATAPAASKQAMQCPQC
jgi:hypothetical protein